MRLPLPALVLGLLALLAPRPARAWQDPDWDKDYILSATSTARAEGVAAIVFP